MSNILNHNRNLFDFILSGEDYWDFHLSEEIGSHNVRTGLSVECLSAYIDFNDPRCVEWDDVFSKSDYIWKEAINDGVDLNYIGVTGVDNGFVSYRKDRITNKDFLELFLKSSYSTNNGDMRLHLRKVNGNNQIYDYSNDICFEDGKEAARLNGGFYQGFFKICNEKYQVLPYTLGDGWSLEVSLKKTDLYNDKYTINNAHPDNKGIFMYIGTRAENKWFEKYDIDNNFDLNPTNYQNDGSIEDEYITENQDVNGSYIQEDIDYLSEIYKDEVDCNNGYAQTSYSDGKYVKANEKCNQYSNEGYVEEGYYNVDENIENVYVGKEYLEKEVEIDGNEKLVTNEGFDFAQPNIVQYDTDNKFLLFNKTEEGFTTKTWKEDTRVTMYDIKRPDLGNYFTLFNKTKDGYTTKNIDGLIEKNNKHYNVLNDIYRNAIAFQIKDNGSIGFKYLVKDCESEVEKYKIESLYSVEGVINDGEWYTISVSIVPVKPKTETNTTCDNITYSAREKMIVSIYVNGKLKVKSDELPILNLKALDDLSDKQQGVPFNISLGGGTQGLCDTISINYRELPKYMLPLEKEFCGSFIGYMRFFRFYSCPLNFIEIRENSEHDRNK